MHNLSHTHKVVSAGNHDLLLDPTTKKCSDKSPMELDWGSIIYLQDPSVALDFPNVRVLTVSGAPWMPKFGTWAFQHPAKSDVWANMIPPHVDILLTHGPPQCHLDMNTYGGRTGSQHLLRELYRARPPLVVFGHIHESYGQEIEAFDPPQKVWEELLLAKGGRLALCHLAWLTLVRRLAVALMRSFNQTQTIHLVNATVVGGQENRERKPVTITL